MKIREVWTSGDSFSRRTITICDLLTCIHIFYVPCGAFIEAGHSSGAPLFVLKGPEATALVFRSVRLYLVLFNADEITGNFGICVR